MSSSTDVKRVFVTVGTTKFDALIEALDTDECMAQLAARGYSHVLMQIGHGTHTPAPRDDDPRFPSVEFFCHDPQYKRHVEAADLVISHAGAGSIMDALSMRKKIVVVVNTLLMDNHQAELADAMAAQNYCIATTCEHLAATLKTADLDALVPYPEPDESAFPRLVDQVMSSDSKQA